MKRILNLKIVLILSLLLSGSCAYFELRKPSLVIRHYDGPYQWGGITLGESTIEETKNALYALNEVVEETMYEASIYDFVDVAMFIDFQRGYRESSMGVWFIDGKAQVIVFFGDELTLNEVQENLGDLDKLAVYMHHYERILVYFEGVSFEYGYIIYGSPPGRLIDDDLEVVNIDENSIFSIYLVHPGVIDLFITNIDGEKTYEYLFEEGGFQDWHGYGEYEVQRPAFLN